MVCKELNEGTIVCEKCKFGVRTRERMDVVNGFVRIPWKVKVLMCQHWKMEK